MKIIGIDIGTTTISTVVMNEDGRSVIEAKTIQNGSFIQTDNEWERIQDVSVIVEKAKAVLDAMLERYSDVVSIGLTGQMHGILYTDREGRCISPLYTWQDGRGNQSLDESGISLTEWIYDKCGVRTASGYGMVTHIYNRRKHLIPEKAVSLCTVPDYLGMVLTGRKTPLLHLSNAASLGFFDTEKGCFLEKELFLAGADLEILPEITGEIEVLGEYRGIPVLVGIGDNQASYLSSVGMQEGGVLLNMGTGGQISVLSEKYFSAPGIEARPFIDGKYLLVGASLCGGRAYAILESFFRTYMEAAGCSTGRQYDLMDRLAAEGAMKEDKMQVDTAFSGTRADPAKRGGIWNISEDNFTPAGMVYGVLHGMSRELYDMYRLIKDGTGIEVKYLVASGNGYRRNEMLQKISSEMFHAELVLAAYNEEAACGAAVSGKYMKTSQKYHIREPWTLQQVM